MASPDGFLLSHSAADRRATAIWVAVRDDVPATLTEGSTACRLSAHGPRACDRKDGLAADRADPLLDAGHPDDAEFSRGRARSKPFRILTGPKASERARPCRVNVAVGSPCDLVDAEAGRASRAHHARRAVGGTVARLSRRPLEAERDGIELRL